MEPVVVVSNRSVIILHPSLGTLRMVNASDDNSEWNKKPFYFIGEIPTRHCERPGCSATGVIIDIDHPIDGSSRLCERHLIEYIEGGA